MSDENGSQGDQGAGTGDADKGGAGDKQPTMAELAAQLKAGEGDQDKGGDKNANSDKGGDKSSQKGGDQNATEMAEFIAKQNNTIESLQNEVKKNSEVVSNLSEKEQLKELNQEVDQAVKKINDGVNGNEKLADAFLNSQYATNANFKEIFDARQTDPGAYEKALGLLQTEWKSMNQAQTDAQVAENQRALQESMRNGTSVQIQDENARLAKMSDGEFMREMNRLANSN